MVNNNGEYESLLLSVGLQDPFQMAFPWLINGGLLINHAKITSWYWKLLRPWRKKDVFGSSLDFLGTTQYVHPGSSLNILELGIESSKFQG